MNVGHFIIDALIIKVMLVQLLDQSNQENCAADHEELLRKQKIPRIFLSTNLNGIDLNRRPCNWICHILRRNCPLRHVIEEKIEGKMDVTGRQGRRLKQLLNDLRKREDNEN
jgi:hypothetical protein